MRTFPRHEMIDLAVEMLVPDEVRAGHPAKLPGVLALGRTILFVSFILVYVASFILPNGSDDAVYN